MIRKMVSGIVIFVAFVCAEYGPNLITDPALDRLVYRLSTVYGIQLPESYNSRPVNFIELKHFFNSADSLDSAGVLSEDESYQLKRAENYFGFPKHLVKWSDESKDIHIKANLGLLGDGKFDVDDSVSVGLKGIISPSLSGNMGKLSFFSGIDVWTEYRSDTLFKGSTYQPYDGLEYNLPGRDNQGDHIRFSDVPRGGIVYNAGRVRLETAIDYLRYGPAVYYPLTLSGMTPPVTYFKTVLDMKALKYSHTVGQLKSEKDKAKFIYTHRLEFTKFKEKVLVGINEVIINGSTTKQNLGDSNRIAPGDAQQVRGWEWVYMIPFVPFKFVEHYAGDRDNAALSMDIAIRYPNRFRWYGEFFLDDMLSPVKLFNDDWGNKWAATLGFQFFGNVLSRDLTLTAEYSHVEPWVYTHYYGGSHSYTNFGQCLGSPLGPNSQGIVVSSVVQLNKLNAMELRFTNIGQNSSVRGGKITDVFQYKDPQDSTRFFDSEKKKFLGHGTVWSNRPAIGWHFNQYGIININAEYALDCTDNEWGSIVSLWGGVRF